jgi:hypothetical protein
MAASSGPSGPSGLASTAVDDQELMPGFDLPENNTTIMIGKLDFSSALFYACAVVSYGTRFDVDFPCR